MIHPVCATFRRTHKVMLLGALVIVAAAGILSGLAGAQGPETSPSVTHQLSGLVGIATGQTARVNVLNMGRRPAAVGLVLIDSRGTVVGVEQCATECQVGQPCPRACTLQPGEAVALEVNADQLALSADGRTHLRAMVSTNSGAREVITTFEIVDNQTQRTTVVAPCIIDMN